MFAQSIGSVTDPTLGGLAGPGFLPNLQGFTAADRAAGLFPPPLGDGAFQGVFPSPLNGGVLDGAIPNSLSFGGVFPDALGAGSLSFNGVFPNPLQPQPGLAAVDEAVRIACACGIDGCDCDDAVGEINNNGILMHHLQSNFQAQALTMLVMMLVNLMQNRGLLAAKGQGKKNKVEEASTADGDDHGHSHASGGSSGGPVQAVERQGKKIGAQIAQKFDEMVAAAARDGVKLTISSGLRTRAEQEKLYAAYKNGTGNLAAKPGTSNHESGEAIDFGNTSGAYEWLKKNAARFGFFNKIASEPWHYSLSGH